MIFVFLFFFLIIFQFRSSPHLPFSFLNLRQQFDDDVVVFHRLMTERFLMTMIINPQLSGLSERDRCARPRCSCILIISAQGEKKEKKGGDGSIRQKMEGRMMGRGAA
jgi:hypothetical protein